MNDTSQEPLPEAVQKTLDLYDDIAANSTAPDWVKTLYRRMFVQCALAAYRDTIQDEQTH